mmetsp:Transcript_17702/g.20281  ORF Transcript_17702/g.20281 Transcript_17702/m.20281 type:complete len:118 (+) Transcript_17702:124-477(+)
MQQTDTSILESLSFEARDQQEMTMTPSSLRPMHIQGVLWKRRDVFKNRWRPRWFVLHPDQRVLTYYLLTNQAGIGPQVISSSRAMTPSRTNSNNTSRTSSSSDGNNSNINSNSNNNK